MEEIGQVNQLRGRVVDDEGRGVSAVAVANGELIERTDASGGYEIEVREGIHRFLTVTVPRDYECADDFFRRLACGEQRRSPDFVLRRRTEVATSFSAAHVTDLHVNTPEDATAARLRDGHVLPEDLAAALAELKGRLDPAFVIATGDLTEDGTTAQLRAFASVAAASGLSIYPGFGMHDANDSLWGKSSEEVAEVTDFLHGTVLNATLTGYFEQIVGPTYYSFDRGDWHFAFYPNEHYAFSLYDQLRKERWLQADLALQPEGKPTLLATHMPPRREWLDQLVEQGVRVVLHGHTHGSKVFTYRGITVAGTPALGWGGLETNPRGFRALQFDDEDVSIELRSVGGRPVAAAPPLAAATSSDELPLVWETKLPAHAHRAAPVSYEQDLLISLQDENEGREGGVCRVRQSDGGIVWHTRLDSAVRNSVATVDGGLLAFTFCGRLLRLDAATGETVWCVDTHGFPERWTASAPLVADGAVYVGAKAGYTAYDIESGEERWSRRFTGTLDLLADHVGDKWGSYFKPIAWDELLIVMISRRGLVALERASGRIVWERELPRCQDYWAAPVLAGDIVITGGETLHLLAVDARTGADRWNERILEEASFDLNFVTGIAVAGDRIYAGGCDGSVAACELESGKRLWQFHTGANVLDMAAQQRDVSTVLAPPVLYDGTLIACGVDAVVYQLDIDSGVCLARTQFEAPITAVPVVLDDGLIVATWEGTLRRYGA